MSTAPQGKWERRPDARTRELLEAALRVFAREGYRATRLERVAREAGVTTGTVYHYFAGKEDLLAQAIRHHLGGFLGDFARAAGDLSLPAPARLRGLLHRAWSYWTTPEFGRVYLLLSGEVRTEAPALFEEWLREGPRRGWSLVESVIRQGQESGEFAAHLDPYAAARFITAGLVQQAVLRPYLGESTHADDFDAFVELALRGLGSIPVQKSLCRCGLHG